LLLAAGFVPVWWMARRRSRLKENCAVRLDR
jgi:hypothetical protein